MNCAFGDGAPTIADLPRATQRDIADALSEAIDHARAGRPTDSWDATQAAWTEVPIRSTAWHILENAANAYPEATQARLNTPGTADHSSSAAEETTREYITHLRAAHRLVPDECDENPHRVTEVLE